MELTKLVVDVAQYQRGVFPKIMPDVVSVIAKLGQGLYEDPEYRAHLAVTQVNGLIEQAYYWPDPLLPAIKQVEFVKSLWKIQPARYLWVDCEQWWSNWGSWYQAVRKQIEWGAVSILAPNRIADMYLDILTRLNAAGIPSGVYTSTGFVGTYAPRMNNWMKEFDLWLAQYGRQPAAVKEMSWEELIAKWLPDYKLKLSPGMDTNRIVGHQFTGDRCLLPGMYSDKTGRTRSAADVSVFNAEWLGRLGSLPVSIPEPEPEPLIVGVTTAEKGLRIRKEPTIYSPILGSFPYHSAVMIFEESRGAGASSWGKIREPIEGWISLDYVIRV